MYGRPMPDYAGAGPLSAYGVRCAGERAGHIYDWKGVETYAAIKESLSELAPMSNRRKLIPSRQQQLQVPHKVYTLPCDFWRAPLRCKACLTTAA